MTAFTEIDFRELFRGSDEVSAAEQFDDWLKTEFLYVRADGPQPGVWMDLAAIERMALAYREASADYKARHPLNDLSAPVLPFPFGMADFMALAESDCFKHSSARWPTDDDVKTAQAINPRTKTLMMVLQGYMLPMPQAEHAASHSPPGGPAEVLPAAVAASATDAASAEAAPPGGSIKTWTPGRIADARAMRERLRKEGHRDYAKRTAEHYRVSVQFLRKTLGSDPADPRPPKLPGWGPGSSTVHRLK